MDTKKSPFYPDALSEQAFIASASHGQEQAQNVLKDDDSLWSTGEKMHSGQWLMVDMQGFYSLHGLVMLAGETPTSFPRRFHIWVSRDAQDWELVYQNLWTDQEGTWELRFEPHVARYVRIMQTDSYVKRSFGVWYPDDVRFSLSRLLLLGDNSHRPPVLTPVAEQKLTAGEPFTLTFETENPTGAPLTYACEGLPAGAVMDGAVLRWTPAVEQSGYTHLICSVSDGFNTDRLRVTLVVSGAPSMPAQLCGTVQAGDVLRLPIGGHNIEKYSCDHLPQDCLLHERTGVVEFAPTCKQAGTYTFTVTGEAEGAAPVHTAITLTVTPAEAATVRCCMSSQDLSLALTPGAVQTLSDAPVPTNGTVLKVYPEKRRQTVVGFGSSLDGSTLYNLTHLTPQNHARLLNTLMGPVDGGNWTFMRICFGSSDFAADSFYSYDDMPAGETDPELRHFSIEPDIRRGYTAYLREVLAKNPDLRLVASIWSPPAWMKTNQSLTDGGDVLDEYMPVLAEYYVRCIRAYAEEGVPVYAVTLQNEPDVIQPYPTTAFNTEQHKRMLDLMYHAFRKAGLDTKLWVMDTNFTSAHLYAWPLLNDPAACAQLDGVAFHDYSGEPTTMGEVWAAFPEKTVHITERSTYNIGGADRVIQYFRNGAVTYNAWLIFLDEVGEPAVGPLDGGDPPQPIRCPPGKPNEWYCTVDYYLYTQVARYMRPGSRILDSDYGSRETVTTLAWEDPDGSIRVYAVNQTMQAQPFTCVIDTDQRHFSAEIPPQTAVTFVCGRS